MPSASIWLPAHRPTGRCHWRIRSKQIELFHRPAHSVRNDLGCDMRGVDAMTAIALEIVQVGFQAPDRRDTGQHDTDTAAPGICDELVSASWGKNLRPKSRAQRLGKISRIAVRIVAAPPEQHPPVGGETEVIENNVAVRHREIARIDFQSNGLAQRFRCDNVAACRKLQSAQTAALEGVACISGKHDGVSACTRPLARLGRGALPLHPWRQPRYPQRF